MSFTKPAAPKVRTKDYKHTIPLSFGMILVTLGVVYGDIGTSPMYVMKAIVSDNGGLSSINPDMIIGALSLIIWTLTLITTVKYVIIAMHADNHGEGGIFALYSLVKHCAKWLIIPAMIGGAALLADGILTPAVTVTTAIEGLRTIPLGATLLQDQGKIVLITLVILSVLFLIQHAGTSSIGRTFGPIMTVWFLFLGASGLLHLFDNISILRALNPLRGLMFLFGPDNHAGLMVLGNVFLATTGAEALYSDMGHVGKANIYASWPFVKICLILNYFGQGAWLLANAGNPELIAMGPAMNPFFEMLPGMMRPFAVILSTLAAIIASQALITGSYTLISEATGLDLMPHMQITYPSKTKGQLYIPMVNTVMWIGCVGVVLFFQTSSRMEAAYGLAITLTMLMTTLLLCVYIGKILKKHFLSIVFVLAFGALEACFFFSSLTKFAHGGYVTVLMAFALFCIMFIWRRGTAIEHAQSVFLPIKHYIDQFRRLRDDESVPMLTDNLVFLIKDPSPKTLDRDILYSIFDKQPKRAKAYWFVNVRVTDEPYTHTYTVDNFGTDFIFKVQLQLGFKVNQRVNAYLRQIVNDLVGCEEIAPQQRSYSIYRNPGKVGSFRFCVLRKVLTPETDISARDRVIISAKYFIRRICGSSAQWYGLENTSLIFEHVPLFARMRPTQALERRPLESAVTVLDDGDTEEDILSASLSDELHKSLEDVEASIIGGDEATCIENQRHDDVDEPSGKDMSRPL